MALYDEGGITPGITSMIGGETLAGQKTDPQTRLFIVKTTMASPNYIAGSRFLDDEKMKKELTYKFQLDIRQAIQATRMRFKGPIYSGCLDFYGLRVCNQDQRTTIESHIQEADAAFKAIFPGLGAEVMFIPLDMGEIARGGLYSNLLGAINTQLNTKVMKRLESVLNRKKDLTPRTKKSLLGMIDQIREINVLGDAGVNARLDEMKAKIDDGALEGLMEDINTEMAKMEGRWGAVEFD